MVIVHDDDLALLDILGDDAVSRSLWHTVTTPTVLIFSRLQLLEALQPDVMLSCLRSSKLVIHEVVLSSGEFLLVSRPLYFSQRPPERSIVQQQRCKC